jgi:hypothetical protein
MRVQNMVSKLSFALRIDEDMHQVVQDAASLAMSDLATAVVTEFTSLSGIMARHYAIRDGYSEQVVYITSKCYFFSFTCQLSLFSLLGFHVLNFFQFYLCFFSLFLCFVCCRSQRPCLRSHFLDFLGIFFQKLFQG